MVRFLSGDSGEREEMEMNLFSFCSRHPAWLTKDERVSLSSFAFFEG